MVSKLQERRVIHTEQGFARDRGCRYAPRCATCPWQVCRYELPEAERAEFRAAWERVQRDLVADAP